MSFYLGFLLSSIQWPSVSVREIFNFTYSINLGLDCCYWDLITVCDPIRFWFLKNGTDLKCRNTNSKTRTILVESRDFFLIRPHTARYMWCVNIRHILTFSLPVTKVNQGGKQILKHGDRNAKPFKWQTFQKGRTTFLLICFYIHYISM